MYTHSDTENRQQMKICEIHGVAKDGSVGRVLLTIGERDMLVCLLRKMMYVDGEYGIIFVSQPYDCAENNLLIFGRKYTYDYIQLNKTILM